MGPIPTFISLYSATISKIHGGNTEMRTSDWNGLSETNRWNGAKAFDTAKAGYNQWYK